MGFKYTASGMFVLGLLHVLLFLLLPLARLLTSGLLLSVKEWKLSSVRALCACPAHSLFVMPRLPTPTQPHMSARIHIHTRTRTQQALWCGHRTRRASSSSRTLPSNGSSSIRRASQTREAMAPALVIAIFFACPPFLTAEYACRAINVTAAEQCERKKQPVVDKRKLRANQASTPVVANQPQY